MSPYFATTLQFLRGLYQFFLKFVMMSMIGLIVKKGYNGERSGEIALAAKSKQARGWQADGNYFGDILEGEKYFQKVTGPYGHHPGRFYTPDAQTGRSHLRHESYSLSETKVLGYVACRDTSQ